jgi:hypothetical protein
MMKYAEVTVSLYWTWQNNYAIMSSDTKTKYPSYFVTRHYTDFLNNGAQVVHSTSSAPEILTISGINSDGKNVMQIINLKNDNVKVDIEGISGNLSKSVSTTEKENWKENGISVTSKNGKVEVELQPQSLNTLVF